MNRKILALGIVITLIAGFVACKAIPKQEKPPTSEPTVQTESTQTDNIQTEAEDTTQQEESQEYVYNFEKYVYQYKTANDLSDEEILASVESEEALYQWLQDSGVTYAEAARDESFGCENVFIGRYLAWLVENDDTLSKAPEPETTTSTSTNDSTTSETAGTTGTTGTTGEVSAKDFLREDGTFDYDGYYAATGRTKEEVAERSKAATEATGGESLTGEEIAKMKQESEEFSDRVAEAFESGIVDQIYNEMQEEGRWVD